MLGLVVTLLIIALIAGILGFGGIAGAAVGIAKIIFLVALLLILESLVFGGFRGGFGRDHGIDRRHDRAQPASPQRLDRRHSRHLCPLGDLHAHYRALAWSADR